MGKAISSFRDIYFYGFKGVTLSSGNSPSWTSTFDFCYPTPTTILFSNWTRRTPWARLLPSSGTTLSTLSDISQSGCTISQQFSTPPDDFLNPAFSPRNTSHCDFYYGRLLSRRSTSVPYSLPPGTLINYNGLWMTRCYFLSHIFSRRQSYFLRFDYTNARLLSSS